MSKREHFNELDEKILAMLLVNLRTQILDDEDAERLSRWSRVFANWVKITTTKLVAAKGRN